MQRQATIFCLLIAAASCWAETPSSIESDVATKPAKIKSGLQPGDKTFAFHVQDVTGPRAGRSLCYACAFGKHSVINIQTKKFDNELLTMLKGLDPLVAPAAKIRGDSKHAFVVYLTEDPDLAEKELVSIAKKLKLKNIPLTIYDELSGPKPYKLANDAEVTVMMWQDTKVTTNHAFAKGGLRKEDVKLVLDSVNKHLKAK